MSAAKPNLLKYKDLFLVFLWRHFHVRYRQSLIGIGWAIFQPLSMTLIFLFLSKRVVSLHVSHYPAPLFFYIGFLIWSFFSTSLTRTIPSIVQHYNLITKVYFPRTLIPLSAITIVFLDFLIAAIPFAVLLYYYKVPLTLAALWFLPLVFLLIIFTIAISFFLSALNVFYRDVQIASGFLIQLWFFVTPVFYPLNKIAHNLQALFFLNPVAFIIENSRYCLVEGRSVDPKLFLLMFIFVVVILRLSVKFFTRIERNFADVI